ncbi:MAG: hypothetical protein KKH51_13980 [Actinobacteria bacterium]|nr:hypothetical protein [Actinomycetota bacterium]
MERVNGAIATSQQLSETLVQVCVGESVVGFIETAGVVFVALHGSRYDRAVEVAQSLAFDVAVAALLAHVRVVDHLTAELSKPSAAEAAPSKPAATARVA